MLEVCQDQIKAMAIVGDERKERGFDAATTYKDKKKHSEVRHLRSILNTQQCTHSDGVLLRSPRGGLDSAGLTFWRFGWWLVVGVPDSARK